MKNVGFLLLMTGLFLSACKKEQPNPATTNAPSASGNPLNAPADYLGEVVKARNSAEKTVDTVGINQAVQLFQVQEGRLPKNLNELVTKKYVGSIPPPPAGMKYDYNPQTGQLKIVPAQ